MATKAEADRVLARFDGELLTNPFVHYASVVEEQNGEFVIEVGVQEERRMRELQNSAEVASMGLAFVVPLSLPIPDEQLAVAPNANRIFIRLRQSGPIRFLQYNGHYRPAKGGSSIGNAGFNDSGTLGAVVRLGADTTNRYLISCWHVFDKNAAAVGSSIYQPGVGDGGMGPLDKVGTLKWGFLSERVDLAFAKLDVPWTQFGAIGTIGYGGIFGKTTANSGLPVKKCGRTTRETTGTVNSTNASIQVNTPIGVRTFRNQLQLTAMAQPGDSGAILLTLDNVALGVVFAGDQTQAFANKIDEVENAIRNNGPTDIGGGSAGGVLFFS